MAGYAEVKAIIDEWDPIGLLKSGCPDDEYAPEIRDIERLSDRVKSVDELTSGIQQVLLEWFGESLPLGECHLAAMKIWTERPREN